MPTETEPASTSAPVSAPTTAPTSALPPRSAAASANFAVAVCDEAWTRAHKVARATCGDIRADSEAAAAYRRAMPTLSCNEKIGDFLACVTHGILIRAISVQEGARLIYAAKVASTLSIALVRTQKDHS